MYRWSIGTSRDRTALSDGVRERRERRFAQRRDVRLVEAPAVRTASGPLGGPSRYAPLGARLPAPPRLGGGARRW